MDKDERDVVIGTVFVVGFIMIMVVAIVAGCVGGCLKNMRAVVVAATGDNNILERVGTKSALVLHTILHTKSYKKFPSE